MKIVSNGKTIEIGGGSDGVTMDQVNTAIDTKLDDYTPLEVYSTEEQRIGTWIDGKSLYRRIIVSDIPSGEGEFAIGEEIFGVDVVAEIRGSMLLNNGYWTEFPYVSSASSSFAVLQFNLDTNKVTYWASASIFTNATLYAEIKYTKTTDQATAALTAEGAEVESLPTAAVTAVPVEFESEEV